MPYRGLPNEFEKQMDFSSNIRLGRHPSTTLKGNWGGLDNQTQVETNLIDKNAQKVVGRLVALLQPTAERIIVTNLTGSLSLNEIQGLQKELSLRYPWAKRISGFSRGNITLMAEERDYRSRKKTTYSERKKQDMSEITLDFKDKVWEQIQNFEDTDREISDILAYCVWEENWPLPRTKFEEDNAQFSDNDDIAIGEWFDTLDMYMEEDPDNFFDDGMEGVDVMPPNLGVVAQTLGLDEDASADTVQRAIARLQGNQFSEEDKSTLIALKEKDQLATYMEVVRPFDAVPGTMEEKAIRLMAIHAGAGQFAHDAQLKDWAAFQEMAGQTKVTEPILVAAGAAVRYSDSDKAPEGETGPATIKIQTYAEEHKVSFNEALATLSQSGPAGLATFKAYYEEEETSRQ